MVYPRWRGEHPRCNGEGLMETGLSPLARGTPYLFRTWLHRSRFIPAGAGNTVIKQLSSNMKAVYPRWRGEHFKNTNNKSIINGLSPLARGTPDLIVQFCDFLRFIPAGAGNTAARSIHGKPTAVYPRWRGEHLGGSVEISNSSGLSPLARGTRAIASVQAIPERFIPAGAGNTKMVRFTSGLGAVYPRWRGEHRRQAGQKLAIVGLSPLARGTLQKIEASQSILRFIPAGAGNTAPVSKPPRYISVYPRWRGEHLPAIPMAPLRTGLSPLARGTPLILYSCLNMRRFIPAGAGNTKCLISEFWKKSVYPRWRGEHANMLADQLRTAGLSPLARGTHFLLFFF